MLPLLLSSLSPSPAKRLSFSRRHSSRPHALYGLNALSALFARSVFCAGVLLLLAAPAFAGTETMIGVDGASGFDGGPNEDGGDGQAGEDAVALSNSGDSGNSAIAEGGLGGAGGMGGSGTPGGSGGSGGDGGLARAEANATALSGNGFVGVEARGGRGGAGGLAGADGSGASGSGGDGGDSSAIGSAVSDGFGSVGLVESFGGLGGFASGPGARAGDGGIATAETSSRGVFSSRAAATAYGGSGGGATLGANGGTGASVSLGMDSTSATVTEATGSLIHEQTARGGDGGQSRDGIAGDGGDAATSVVVDAAVGGSIRIELVSRAGAAGLAFGDGVAGAAGNATSNASASLDGSVRISTESRGGDASRVAIQGASGRNGGDANSQVTGTSTSLTSDVTLFSRVSGGQGGEGGGIGQRGGDGGIATGSLSGSVAPGGSGRTSVGLIIGGGTGGGGSVGADAGNGADASAENAVRGVGSDVLLGQTVSGGASGRIFSDDTALVTQSRGGNATSHLEASNPLGDLSVNSVATGGSASSVGARAGDATASGVAIASGDATVRVSSTAGRAHGFSGGDGAGTSGSAANVGAVRGDSTGGGDVDVQLDVTVGSGGDSFLVGGNGGDANLVDAVDGNTTGSLILRQHAFAGNGGAIAGIDPFAIGGFAGNATSELTRSKSSDRLLLSVIAEGGDAEDLRIFVAPAGGSALSRADGHNDAGEVAVEYRATGGNGSDSNRLGRAAGTGGAATSVARASSSGDGNDVLIGLGLGSMSEGGRGGTAGSATGVLGGGDGGRAETDVEGVAQGDSRVSVEANAIGGRGGSRSTFAAGDPRGGEGGVAEAHARGSNAGARSVTVVASAEGGIGGAHSARTNGGDGGQAIATAHGESSGGGNVTATARVVGGIGIDGGSSVEGRLVDAVSGSTTGVLRLIQEAVGGAGSSTGAAGSAVSSLDWLDDDGGRLELESIATGGRQGTPGSATASVTGTGHDDVFVTARATGGSGSVFAADGGGALLGPVSGTSLGGGLVVVEGEAIGGRGIQADTRPAGQRAGAGADVVLDNAVDGQTTGTLRLIQRAIAGAGGGFGVESLPGDAGDATSLLERMKSSTEFEVVVGAIGGNGGGQSQTQSPNPIPAPASNGGSARAETTVANDSGLVSALVIARGGRGGDASTSGVGGDGGDASASATAGSTGDGNSVVIGGSGEFGAIGGHANVRAAHLNPGEAGIGGDADSRSVGTALGDSAVSVHDRATGGEGFDGGDAVSFAEGHNTGMAEVAVLAEAIGGRSVRPDGRGGTAVATARGTSTTGNVLVTSMTVGGESGETAVGSGPSTGVGVAAVNTVSGSTAGELTLTQIAVGGASNSLDPDAGSAGTASSSIEAANEGGGALRLVSEAIGGAGLEDYVRGGSATASARGFGVGNASVDVEAISRGGQGAAISDGSPPPDAGMGGLALGGSVSGESAGGGAVSVRALAFGGDSVRGGGIGGEAMILDAVSGSTSGQLTLDQFARGGTGSSGGRATSRFDESITAAEVLAISRAEGGRAEGAASLLNGQAGRGGDSESVLRISNDQGAVEAFAFALGGSGFDAGPRDTALNGDGGNAMVDAFGRTIGDGQTLVVGDSSGMSRSGAIGGRAGFNFSPTDLGGGSGGHATSRSEGVAEGDSFVQVYDRAFGARGRNSNVSAGDGGNARSMAIGRNAGFEGVVVVSEAGGGFGGSGPSFGPGPPQRGANGSADASAIGFSTLGELDVRAISVVGTQGVTTGILSAGDAVAHSVATGTGSQGFVQAMSTGNAGEVTVSAFETNAIALVSVGSVATAETRAGRSAADVFHSAADAAAFVNGSHSRDGEWARIGFQMASTQEGPDIILASTARLDSNEMSPDSLDGVFVSFLDTRIDEEQFSTLRFRVGNAGETLIERVFDRADDALVFFSTVLDLGDFDDLLTITEIDLEFALSMENGTLGASFGTYFSVGTVAVPEPGTGTLLALGLVLMARRRSWTRNGLEMESRGTCEEDG